MNLSTKSKTEFDIKELIQNFLMYKRVLFLHNTCICNKLLEMTWEHCILIAIEIRTIFDSEDEEIPHFGSDYQALYSSTGSV